MGYIFKYTKVILHYKDELIGVRMRQLIKAILKDSDDLLFIQSNYIGMCRYT